jgi:hypothetical protein
MQPRVTHHWTDDIATICVEGLAAPVRMLHLTDTHLMAYDSRDGEHAEACRAFCEQFEADQVEKFGKRFMPENTFRGTMAQAASADLDLLALTGDIVHYPSAAAVTLAAAEIATLGVPAMYMFGNHDVHYTDEPIDAAMRQKWLHALEPLHHGKPDCAARDVGGIRFVCVDSSLAQISPTQLESTRKQFADGQPTVLLTHWPLSLPTLRPHVIEQFAAPIMLGDPDWSASSREEWQVGADTPETLEFVRLVTTAPNLVAIFCGHVHFPHADAVNMRAVQYTGAPGYQGGRRLVEFRSLDT